LTVLKEKRYLRHYFWLTLCKLKVLHVIFQSDDYDYLDADRWEQLITKYLPELEKFYLDFHNDGGNDPDQPSLYSRETNRFFSSFFIKRQWIG
jgi:hypothetical protein